MARVNSEGKPIPGFFEVLFNPKVLAGLVVFGFVAYATLISPLLQ